jgi:hypothetical protein
VTATRTDTPGEHWGYRVDGVLTNVGGSASILAQTTTVLYESDAAFNCVASIRGGGTKLAINCAGDAGKTVRWVGRVDLVTVKL